jgi:hypothetical protein
MVSIPFSCPLGMLLYQEWLMAPGSQAITQGSFSLSVRDTWVVAPDREVK